MNQQAKRIKELFGYARTLTKEQGIGTMCVRAAGFFQTALFRQAGAVLAVQHGAGSPAQRPRGGNLPPSFLF